MMSSVQGVHRLATRGCRLQAIEGLPDEHCWSLPNAQGRHILAAAWQPGFSIMCGT